MERSKKGVYVAAISGAVLLSAVAIGAFWRISSVAGTYPSATGGRAATANRVPAVASASAKEEEIARGAGILRGASPALTLQERIAQALHNPSEDARSLEFLKLLEEMKPEDGPAIRELIRVRRAEGINLESEWSALYRKWGAVDPLGALQAISDVSDASQGKKDATLRIFQGWTMKDPEKALQWITQNTEHPSFESAFAGFIGKFAEIDSARATKLVISSFRPDDPLLSTGLQKITWKVFSQGSADGLKTWFNTLPEGPEGDNLRKTASLHAVPFLMQKDPALAAEWVAAQAATAWRSNATIGSTAYQYASKDPKAAMAWVASLPPNPGSQNGVYIGVSEVVSHWVQKNPGEFEGWIAAAPDSMVKQQAIHDYALIVGRRDPAAGLAWLNQVSNPYLHADGLSRLQR